MKKANKLFQRRNYFRGKKMMSISFVVLFNSFINIGTMAVAFIVSLSQAVKYTDISYLIVFVNFILYMLASAVGLFIVVVIVKGVFWVIGRILIYFGEPDKVELQRVNDGNRVEIQITNGENEQFEGELKIMKIEGKELPTPLSMGIYRSKNNIKRKIVIPSMEPVSIIIGLFDSILGGVYIPDVYNQQQILPPNTRVHTKLIGNLLPSGIEIIKENNWNVNYEQETGKNFSLSNAVEVKKNIGLGVGIQWKLDSLRNKKGAKKR